MALLPLASLFMPILEIKRAVESVLSVFCMEEVAKEAKKAYLGLLTQFGYSTGGGVGY